MTGFLVSAVIYATAGAELLVAARFVGIIIKTWPSLLPPPPKDPPQPYWWRAFTCVIVALVLLGWPIIAVEWASR